MAKGSELKLVGEQAHRGGIVHGGEGLGGVETGEPAGTLVPEQAAALIVRTVRERPGQVHVLATGPLTNVAVALRLEPELPQLVEGVTIMGGAALAPGNVTPVAEANIWHDPEAAQAVLSAPWPKTMVPLDATMRELMTEEQRRALAGSPGAVARFAAEILDHYMDFYTTVFGRRCCACHDALAAGIAVGDVVPTRAATVKVTVDTAPGRGGARPSATCGASTKAKLSSPVGTARWCWRPMGDFPGEVVQRLLRN